MTQSDETAYHVRSHFLFKGKIMRLGHKHPAGVRRKREKACRQIQAALRKTLTRARPKRILDVGTGFGENVIFLSNRFGKSAKIWSIDASPEVLVEARRALFVKGLSKRVRFKHATAEALPFSARHFDLVVSILSLHHLSNPFKGLREMARVSAHGGSMIVADWKPVRSPVIPHSARAIPSARYVVRVLKRLGFSTVLQEGRYWYLVEAMK